MEHLQLMEAKALDAGNTVLVHRLQRLIDQHLDGKHGEAAAAAAEDLVRKSTHREARKAQTPLLRRKRACAAEKTLGAGARPRPKKRHKDLEERVREEEAKEAEAGGVVDDVEDLEGWDGGAAPRVGRRRVDNGGEVDVSTGVAAADDDGLCSVLKPHQREGVAFLSARHDQGKGGVLAFSMGLGKTLTTLAFLEALSRKVRDEYACRAVVVCPKSVAPEWRAEHARHASRLSFPCFALDGLDAAPAAVRAWADRGGLLIVSAPTLARLVVPGRSRAKSDAAEASACATARDTLLCGAHVLVVDEMHLFKSAGTHTTRAIEAFATRVRVGLTGTPLSNSPDDFYEIANIVDKSVFDGLALDKFRTLFSKPIVAAQFHDASEAAQKAGREQTAVLRTLLAPCMMIRSQTVLRGLLPPKRETMLVYPVPVGKRRQIEAAMAEAGRNYLSMQPVLDGVLRDDKAKVACGLLNQMEEGDAAIVFSRHPETLLAVRKKLGGGLMRVLSGDTNGAARVELLRDFDAGVFPVLGLTYGAGAVGINCQRANLVVLLEPTENPTASQQAVCRAWRLGQKKRVDVYRLAAEDTVDVRIGRRGAVKTSMAHSLLHAQRVDTHLNAADASGDACSESVALHAPTVAGGADDQRVLALGRAHMSDGTPLLAGWVSYDAYFDDVKDDATDAAAAQNKHNRKLNEKRAVRTSDGVEHEVRGFVVDLPLRTPASSAAEEARELIPPPIPIVRCTAQDTIITLAPHAMPPRVTFEVSFCAAVDGAVVWTTPEPVPSRRLKRGRRESDTSDTLVCCARFVRLEEKGPWSAASAPFAPRAVA